MILPAYKITKHINPITFLALSYLNINNKEYKKLPTYYIPPKKDKK